LRKLIGRVKRAELAGGAMVRLDYPPFDVLVAEVAGDYAAIEDACNHAGASLSEGDRADGGACVVCPMHGYLFDLRTGALVAPLGLCDAQRRYDVETDGDDVVVWDPGAPVVLMP